MNNSVNVLRDAVNKAPKVESGTVVKFVSGGVYTYVAIFVAGRWHLSGEGRYWGRNTFSNEDFLEILAEVESIEVAIEWAAL